jgi:hypothetical protein
MLAMAHEDGWRSAQWGIISALVFAILTGAVAFYRQFSILEERMEALRKLNDTQSQLLDTLKDGARALQQQVALLAHEDVVMAKELKEQRDFLLDAMTRLRAVEQRMGPPMPPGGKP